jgi:hypothetical protein
LLLFWHTNSPQVFNKVVRVYSEKYGEPEYLANDSALWFKDNLMTSITWVKKSGAILLEYRDLSKPAALTVVNNASNVYTGDYYEKTYLPRKKRMRNNKI